MVGHRPVLKFRGTEWGMVVLGASGIESPVEGQVLGEHEGSLEDVVSGVCGRIVSDLIVRYGLSSPLIEGSKHTRV